MFNLIKYYINIIFCATGKEVLILFFDKEKREWMKGRDGGDIYFQNNVNLGKKTIISN